MSFFNLWCDICRVADDFADGMLKLAVVSGAWTAVAILGYTLYSFVTKGFPK